MKTVPNVELEIDGFLMAERHDELLTLYKYRSVRGEQGRTAVTDIISHNRMFWQSPVRFNDPFDCDPYWIFGETARDRAGFFNRVVANELKDAPRYARRSKKRELESRAKSHYELDARAAFRTWMEESAVTCFSTVNDSILMWGHYADAHTGVCLIFRETMKPRFLAFDVEYQPERQAADITKLAGTEMFKRAVLTKAEEWRYEQEMRMFEYRVPPSVRDFPSEALVGVIFGARMENEDRAFVESLVDKRKGTPLKLFDAALNERAFRIDIAPRQKA